MLLRCRIKKSVSLRVILGLIEKWRKIKDLKKRLTDFLRKEIEKISEMGYDK